METHVNKEIILSIGMIVKNEAAVLHRCLKSLQPLRDAIPCQLIIVDTGSTDHTVDIAKEYTDQVYHFTWCDDFAAARNFGVERAKGKWFLYIDADEWFEDVTELIEFFQSGTYKRYGNAAYTIRNYLTSGKHLEYGDILGVHMADMSYGVKFCGRIHEAIITYGRKKTLTATIAGHSGYAEDNSEALIKNKEKRNISLLEKAIAEDPKEPSNYWYMSKQYPIYVKQKEHFQYITKAYEAVQLCKKHLYYSPIIRNYAICLYIQGEKEHSAEEITRYLALNRKDSIFVEIDLTYQLILINLDQEHYRQTLKLIADYRRYYDRIEKGELYEADYTCASLSYSSENYQKSFLLEGLCHLKLKEVKSAFALIQQIKLEEFRKTNFKECIPGMVEISIVAEAYSYVARLYQQVLEERTEEEVYFLEQTMERYLPTIQKKAMCEAFCSVIQMTGVSSDYQKLQQIRNMLIRNDRNNLLGIKAIRNLMEKKKFLSAGYTEVLLAAWWYGQPISQELNMIDMEQLPHYTITVEAYISQMEDSIGNLVNRYVTAAQKDTSLKEVYYVLCTLEHLLVAENGIGEEQRPISKRKTELFESYIQLGEQYIYQLYAPAILTVEQIAVLPRHYRFFYYAGQGLSIREKNFQQYGVLIKKALEQCPLFTALVQASLQFFEEETANIKQTNQVAKTEFETYAQMVKEKIAVLITQDMKEEAIHLIQSYEKINPKDLDGIALLHSLLESEYPVKYKN